MQVFSNVVYVVYFVFLVAVSTIDQGGGGSGVFRNIWQQNAKNMNQMLGGNQIVGEFAPCSMKFTGINSQLNYGGNQFGRFQPGTAIGKRSVERTEECPCPGVDTKGCPICSCSNKGLSTPKVEVQDQTTQTFSQPHVQYTVTPNLVQNSKLRTNSTTPGHMTTTTARGVPVKPGPSYDQHLLTTVTEHNNGLLRNSDVDKNKHFVENSSAVVSLKSGDLYTYYGIIGGLSVVLFVVTILTFVFLHKWRAALENLKHEQNELYFAEKSFRLSSEKQTEFINEDVPKRKQSSSTSSSTTRLSTTESCQDSVFTVDSRNSTDIQPPIGSPAYTGQLPETPSAPLMTSGSNIFSYPPEAYSHDYLELM